MAIPVSHLAQHHPSRSCQDRFFPDVKWFHGHQNLEVSYKRDTTRLADEPYDRLRRHILRLGDFREPRRLNQRRQAIILRLGGVVIQRVRCGCKTAPPRWNDGAVDSWPVREGGPTGAIRHEITGPPRESFVHQFTYSEPRKTNGPRHVAGLSARATCRSHP